MDKILITPLARNLANTLNIDYSKIIGSGYLNRIMLEDVLKFNDLKTPEVSSSQNANNLVLSKDIYASFPKIVTKVKVSSIRKVIAKAMSNSWDNVAYTNLITKIDVTQLFELRTKVWEGIFKKTGIKLSFLPFITRAIVEALREFPIFTGTYDEISNSIVMPKENFNIGIAVDTKDGLMVPVVKNASKMSTFDLGKEIIRLASNVRDKKIKAEEMRGAHFTITNYGSVGSLFGTPVINYPELAIAGIGAFIDEIIPTNEGYILNKSMYLTVAADHRWIDGATIGRFASRVKELLENPELLGVY